MVNILVTGVGASGVGYQVLTALRLAKTTYRVITADTTHLSLGLSHGDKSYLLPLASSSEYIDEVIQICNAEKIQVLFYGSEPELKKFSDNREIFEDLDVYVPLNPKALIDACLDKNVTMTSLAQKGFSVPESHKIRSQSDLRSIDRFPVVMKPSVGGGGSANLMIAQNKNELMMFGSFLLNTYEEFIAQEYVGDQDSEFTVGVLCDPVGRVINSIGMKRIIDSSFGNRLKVNNTTGRSELGRNLVISSGLSQGWIGKFPEVTSVCEEIAKSFAATAAINIQCRLVDGKVVVFEINPRFSGTTSLRALAGYNEPDILIRQQILKENIQLNFSFREGCILRSLEGHFVE